MHCKLGAMKDEVVSRFYDYKKKKGDLFDQFWNSSTYAFSHQSFIKDQYVCEVLGKPGP